jgi:hypothetical protein
MFKNLRTRRTLGGIAAATLAAGLMTAGGATAAHADAAFTIHISPNSSFGLLLDDPGGSGTAGTPIIQWYANGGANQNWTFLSYGGNFYKIINGASGQCLTTGGVAGYDVVQEPCNDSAGQVWATGLTPGSIYAWTIRNPASGLYLDVRGASSAAGAHLDVWYYNGGSNQYFAAL